jgi:hypothetical protein
VSTNCTFMDLVAAQTVGGTEVADLSLDLTLQGL